MEADSSNNYDQVTVAYTDSNARTIDRTVKSYGNVMVAVPEGGSGNIYASLQTVLGI